MREYPVLTRVNRVLLTAALGMNPMSYPGINEVTSA
jgi:hypothetical protein